MVAFIPGPPIFVMIIGIIALKNKDFCMGGINK